MLYGKQKKPQHEKQRLHEGLSKINLKINQYGKRLSLQLNKRMTLAYRLDKNI